jgi:signal peptidase
MAYVLPSACWGFLALVALKACGFGRIKSWFNAHMSIAAASVAICYVIILINIGIFAGFGRSPYSFAPIGLIINAIFVFSTLLGMEFSRACVVKGFGRKRPFLTLGLVTLLYSLLSISMVKFMGLNDPLALTKFLGIGLLPAVAENLLASYLSLVGGPIASLAYRAPLAAFWWFSPILPRLPWGIEALLGVMMPTVGFLAVTQFTPRIILQRLGIAELRGFGRAKGSSAGGWVAASVACVLMVWASTGLLGVWPTTILSGSMRPSLDVGDMVIVRDVSAGSIRAGDIVQYWSGEEMVIHRVVEVYEGSNGKLFVTKGDANSSPDPTPVQAAQVRGKVILAIPKLGWAAIAVKTLAGRAWQLMSANPLPTLFVVTLGACIACLRKVRSNGRRTLSWKRGSIARRLAVPLSLLLVTTAACGFAYSHWSETLFIRGTVTTGKWRPVTRTQGFWSTHPDYASDVWLSIPSSERVIGSKNMGDRGMLGAFWSDIPKKSDGTMRTSLDRARMQLLQQLVAAMLNVQAFGDDLWGTGGTLIAAGKAAFSGDDEGEILRIAEQLDAFNKSGDAEPLPPGVDPGRADPQGAREMADIAFWDVLP